MIESGRQCTEIAQQLQAVEHAITNAKRVLIHDHIDQCLQTEDDSDLADMKLLAKLL
jgi:DNA-binding FrmR family transcriptional regulator